MFVLPAPAEPSAFWTEVKCTENFSLQQSASGGGVFLRNVLATIHNVLETKPPPFRIVYRHSLISEQYILLAVGETKEEIEADWKWLDINIMPMMAELDESTERANFVVTKIRFLATAEGGQEVTADRKMRAAATTFRQTFDVGRSENLVTYYSCALQGNFMMHQGWLYLSEHYFCFYSYMFGSEKKIMFELRDINDLAKTKSMGGVRDDAIEVVTKDGSRYSFANMFHRDETFDMLSQLTANTMKRILLNSEYASTSTSNASKTTSSSQQQQSQLPLTQQHRQLGTRSLAEQIAHQRRNEEFQGEFGLPSSETLLSVIEIATMSFPGSHNVYAGKLYLSSSFVCYMSRDFRGCRIIMPMAAVRRIERANSIDSHNIPCFELVITVWHQMGVSFKVPRNSSECDRWCDALRGQLKAMVEEQRMAKEHTTPLTRYTLRAFCRACASEHLLKENENNITAKETFVDCLGTTFGFPGDPKVQKEGAKRKYWIKYMKQHGRNLTIIRRSEFDRLIRVGLPNCLRGEIWELSSGAMYLRFQNYGVYEKHINEYLDNPGPYAEEIEKDLNRSLPEYVGYQSPEGIDALRRVLNAYSLCDSELGYCQAMNIVASTMLIFMTEEQVFWTLRVMCDRMVPGYYSPSMYGASLDQSIFQSLVQETMPSLAESFKRHDIQLSIACLPWFLTLFVNSMPLVYALRVLDLFFLEGPKILFRIGLAILKVNGAVLLESTDDGTFLFNLKEYFNTLGDLAYPDSQNKRGRQVTKFHELLYVAYSDFPAITQTRIEELRRSHQLRIVHSVEEFSKRTFLRNVVDAGGFTKEQLSLLYDRFYSVLFYYSKKQQANNNNNSSSGSGSGSGNSNGDVKMSGSKVSLDVYGFARFMYEMSSWMRVQIKEAKERIQNHRDVNLATANAKSKTKKTTASSSSGKSESMAGKRNKTDDVARETETSLENPGWFITSLFKYTSKIVPPVARSLVRRDSESGHASQQELSSISSGSVHENKEEKKEEKVEEEEEEELSIEDIRVSFQQCVIALGRIVNTDLLTRMDVFFDVYALEVPGMISRKEMFQLSEAILYIGHGEDIEVGQHKGVKNSSDNITNEEQLLRCVSDLLRRAISYGEMSSGGDDGGSGENGRRKEFSLPRNLFRVVVLEDELLEQFFSETVPASFRFTDGVELANPLRAISTHLPSTPLTPRSGGHDSMAIASRLLAGGRSMAEGMSARVAQTIALGSSFVDHKALTPVVQSAAESRDPVNSPEVKGGGFVVTEDMAKTTLLANHVESDNIAKDIANMTLQENNGDKTQDQPRELWVNAPQDPYENLLDEVDQLLGEIKDDDDFGEFAGSNNDSNIKSKKKDVDFQVDDEEDDDLKQLLELD